MLIILQSMAVCTEFGRISYYILTSKRKCQGQAAASLPDDILAPGSGLFRRIGLPVASSPSSTPRIRNKCFARAFLSYYHGGAGRRKP